MRGGTVCASHGGLAPQTRAASDRRQAEARAASMVRALVPVDSAPIGDPMVALARLAGEADAFRGVLAGRVNELAQVPTAQRAEGDLDQLRAELSLYERALDRTSKFCEALIRSNYLERHAAIEEAQVYAVLGIITHGLNLISDQAERDAVRKSIVEGLRELQAVS